MCGEDRGQRQYFLIVRNNLVSCFLDWFNFRFQFFNNRVLIEVYVGIKIFKFDKFDM